MGWEHAEISDLTSATLGAPPISLSADRFYGGGVAGLAVGFRHIHVAAEIEAAYQTISGSYNQTSVTVSGLTLSPGAALWWEF